MLFKKGVLFCDLNPTCYAISEKKEILKRHIKNWLSKERVAKTVSQERLPNTVCAFRCHLIKRAPGVNLTHQLNKAVNIQIACSKINGILIHPGEVFSFWQTVGKISKRKGYKEGRVIKGKKLITGIGGGLCNLGNSIHRLVLHTPLDVVEFHKHSDALAPDEGERIPFSSGTSVSYNYIDYRFKNNTDQTVQLLVWCEGEELLGEIRSQQDYPHDYALVEEDHHFRKEGEKYYRFSKIYRNVILRATQEVVAKELILDNRSEVMFDESLIPGELIRA